MALKFFLSLLCLSAMSLVLAGQTPLPAALQAAQTAAASDAACTASEMGDFYWEIGDANSVLVSGAQGRVDALKSMPLASASKWLFGAYVLERVGMQSVRKTPALLDGLRFTSGYSDFKVVGCLLHRTVGGCWESASRGVQDPETVGKFFYNGGHDQKLGAVDLQMGGFTARQVTQSFQQTLQLDAAINMSPLDVQLAGGLQGNASAYAGFLRRILRKELVMGENLGGDAVCAQPLSCPQQALSSPIRELGEPWLYSYNHWVEVPRAGATPEAFSSPGLFGFYPWISADQRWYGVIARQARNRSAYLQSVACGRAIRRAFVGAL